MHLGLAPNNVRKAEVRMTLGQILRQDPRPLHVAMKDAFATADAAHVDAKSYVSVDGETNAQDLARLLEASERVMKLGKTIVDAGVLTKMVELSQQSRDEYLRQLIDAMVQAADALGLPLTDRNHLLLTISAILTHEPLPPRPVEMEQQAILPTSAYYVKEQDIRLLTE
jgi:hypothetical protein